MDVDKLFQGSGAGLVAAGTGLLSSITGGIASLFPAHTALGSWGRARTGAGLTGAQIEQNQFNAEQAQKDRDWKEQMDNTKVQRSVADMKAAGINPAMMMAGAGPTASTPSATAASGGSPGTPQGNSFENIITGLMARNTFKLQNAQMREINARTENINADTAQKEAQTRESTLRGDAIEIDNKTREEMNRLNLEGQRNENELNKERISEVRSNIRNIDADTISKEADIPLKEAQTMKYNMDAYTAAALLPYHQKVMETEATENAANAQFLFTKAAFDQGLIDGGYVSGMCREILAGADTAEIEKEVANWDKAVKTGDPDGIIYKDKFSAFVGRVAAAGGALIQGSQIGSILGIGVNKSSSTSNATVRHEK